MSLKDVLDSANRELHPNPELAHRAMLDELDRTRDAFAARERQGAGHGWFTVDTAGRVAFTPTRPDGQPIIIGGQANSFWTLGEFPAVLDAFEQAIRAGELDDQLVTETPAGKSLPLDHLKNRLRDR